MRKTHTLLATTGLGVLVAIAGFAGADETRTKPVPQKRIESAFLGGLVGSWTTTSTSTHDGKTSKGTGKATFAKGIGETAVLETYEMSGPGPDGTPMNFHGHAVIKVSDDGKTANLWWFCNMSPDVMKLTGTITDSAMDLSGDSPMGEKVTLSMKKSGDGFDFKLTEGKNVMTETYAKVR